MFHAVQPIWCVGIDLVPACILVPLLFIICEASLITFGNVLGSRYHLVTLTYVRSSHDVSNDCASHSNSSSLDNDKHRHGSFSNQTTAYLLLQLTLTQLKH